MVEIRYGDQFEVSELAGQTVCEAREQFKAEFGIPNKAHAKLNGSKVKSSAETDTVLNDDDKLTFVVSRGKGAYLVGALLLALATTGGIFAAGWINATTTLSATTVESNFADVSVSPEATSITWSGWGAFKGTIAGPYGLFNIVPGIGYTGDLVITVSIGNGASLAETYRQLSLTLEVVDTTNATVDIGAGNSVSWTMLTMDNGSASMYVTATDNLTVRVKKGFYITHGHPFGNWTGDTAPELFCEVAQR